MGKIVFDIQNINTFSYWFGVKGISFPFIRINPQNYIPVSHINLFLPAHSELIWLSSRKRHKIYWSLKFKKASKYSNQYFKKSQGYLLNDIIATLNYNINNPVDILMSEIFQCEVFYIYFYFDRSFCISTENSFIWNRNFCIQYFLIFLFVWKLKEIFFL